MRKLRGNSGFREEFEQMKELYGKNLTLARSQPDSDKNWGAIQHGLEKYHEKCHEKYHESTVKNALFHYYLDIPNSMGLKCS